VPGFGDGLDGGSNDEVPRSGNSGSRLRVRGPFRLGTDLFSNGFPKELRLSSLSSVRPLLDEPWRWLGSPTQALSRLHRCSFFRGVTSPTLARGSSTT